MLGRTFLSSIVFSFANILLANSGFIAKKDIYFVSCPNLYISLYISFDIRTGDAKVFFVPIILVTVE